MSYTFLDFHPSKSKSPRHIGLIPDGTRRWAQKHEQSLAEAYIKAMHKIVQCVEFFFQQGSESVSVYLSSVQNFRRSNEEVETLFQAEAMLCEVLLPNFAESHDTKVKIAGNKNMLPDYFQNAIYSIVQSTASYSSTQLFLCAAYSPLDEVVHAVKNSNNIDDFINCLWVPEPLDLVIRTSGANLLSNFLPLQVGYARIYTIDKLFNDTEIADFADIIREFKNIARLYGD